MAPRIQAQTSLVPARRSSASALSSAPATSCRMSYPTSVDRLFELRDR